MASTVIQTTFASGEWAPKLRSRVDIQKYKAGASLLRNFYVDFSGGGASTRPGTEFMAQCAANGARLIPFQPSTNIGYILEFGNNYIRFYSNGAQVMSGGIPYQISSPYAASDLFPNQATGNPGIKFVQDVTSLIITHPGYTPYILTINAPTNWTLQAINFGPTIGSPPTPTLDTSHMTAGSFSYQYAVSSVDTNGHESSAVASAITAASFAALTAGNGSIVINWTAVPGAVFYNVYKVTPTYAVIVPSGAFFGFIGSTENISFVDSAPGIAPDFSQSPSISNNPFSGGSVTAITISAPGVYTTVPTITIAAPASGSQAFGAVALALNTAVLSTLIISNPGGINLVGVRMFFSSGIVLTILAATFISGTNYQVTSISITNPGSFSGSGTAPASGTPHGFSGGGGLSYVSGSVTFTWGVGTGIVYNGGYGYTAIPAITFSSGAATAVATISVAGNPGTPGWYQERLVLANQAQAPQTFNMSRPGDFFNFNYSFPAEDDDSITAAIIGEELNDIRALVPVSSGLIALTGQGAWQINGGGGVSAATPITPSNASAQTQAFNGATDIRPVKINLDLLYVTNKGNYVRDFAFNIYANVYTGSDISVLSNHLFFGYQIVDWTWAEEPFKTLWAIRNDGVMLSLGYVKEQELIGWAHHDTNGQFLSIASVIETVNGNTVDAVYVIVQRFINGSYVQYVERLADRYFPYGMEDSWCVDCALQTAPQASPVGTLTISGVATVGASVTLTDTTDAPFTAPMVGWVVRAGGGIYTITGFTSTSVVTATVTRLPTSINQYTGVPIPVTAGYTIWQPVNSVSGLTQLAGQQVVGVVDGIAVGPFTVSGGGSVSLGRTGTKVTLGLAFLPQLQTLPLDLGEPTIQGKWKKIPSVVLRVADTLGLQIGTSFANAVTMKDFTLGNIGTLSNGVVSDLVSGDGLTIIDQDWQELGNYCIQQNLPYPATVLGAFPNVTVGSNARQGSR